MVFESASLRSWTCAGRLTEEGRTREKYAAPSSFLLWRKAMPARAHFCMWLLALVRYLEQWG